jgi:hypothetical protein
VSENRVYRYEVPIDDQWHACDLSGAILHVDCRRYDAVEFWALSTDGPQIARHFRVFGTGHPVPADAVPCGSALSPHGGFAAERGELVWHLFEAKAPR